MAFDHLFTQARIEGYEGEVDLAVRDGKFTAIGCGLDHDGPKTDLAGRLVIAGLVDTHIHLDKSCLLSRFPSPDGSLAGAIQAVSKAKPTMCQEDIYERGRQTLEKAIKAGTNLMRTHVEIDPRIGLRGFQAVSKLKADYAFAIDLEICVFPQEGLTNDPGCADLLVQALDLGADLIGGCPYTDTDSRAHLEWVFATAKRFDVDIDLHLDFDLDPSWMALHDVIELTETSRYGGRVACGHVTKLAMLDIEDRKNLALRLAEVGIGLTALPATDLFLMGRDLGPSPPRGVAPMHEFRQHGVCCSLATNNVLNAFTPFGDCSLTRMANLYGHIAQTGDAGSIADLLSMVTKDARLLMNRPSQPIHIGAQANFVVLDAPDALHAVAEAARPILAVFNGLKIVEHPSARLLKPASTR